MSKYWWQHLFDLLAGEMTKRKLPSDTPFQAVLTAPIAATGYSVTADEAQKRAAIVARMRSHIGVRKYKLGAEILPADSDGAEFTDCSEEVEDCYRTAAAMYIPDGSPMQYAYCQPVIHALPGDLHFLWNDKWGRIGHVMVDTGEGTVVHAKGGVGVCEEPLVPYVSSPRYRGCRRHPDFARPPEDRPA